MEENDPGSGETALHLQVTISGINSMSPDLGEKWHSVTPQKYCPPGKVDVPRGPRTQERCILRASPRSRRKKTVPRVTHSSLNSSQRQKISPLEEKSLRTETHILAWGHTVSWCQKDIGPLVLQCAISSASDFYESQVGPRRGASLIWDGASFVGGQVL